MSMITRVADVASTFLPVEQGRQLLLLPVRGLRAGAVTVARTTRHWELALEGVTEPEIDLRGDTSTSSAATSPQAQTDRIETEQVDEARSGESLTSDDLAIGDWAELSLGDAEARISGLDDSELRTLLDYERGHGHRPQYTLLLENRLEAASITS